MFPQAYIHIFTGDFPIRHYHFPYTVSHTCLRKATFYRPKGRLLQAKRPPFASRKTAFCKRADTQQVTKRHKPPGNALQTKPQGLKDENKIVLNFELKRIFTIFASRRQDAVRQRQIKKNRFSFAVTLTFHYLCIMQACIRKRRATLPHNRLHGACTGDNDKPNVFKRQIR